MTESTPRAVFRERSTGPGWMVVVGIITLALLLVVMGLAIPELIAPPQRVTGGLVALLVVSTVMVVIAVVILITRRSTIVITETHVDAYLNPFRIMHIPLDAIEAVDVIHVEFNDSRGWGWRLVGTDQYLMWSGGPAVRLTLTKERSRVLRSDRAGEMVATIASVGSDPRHG